MSVWQKHQNNLITIGVLIFTLLFIILVARVSMPQPKLVPPVAPIPTTMIVAPTTMPTILPTTTPTIEKTKTMYPTVTSTTASHSSIVK